MSKDTHFSPDLFKFLRQLRRNNDREWFRANKHRYESDVRDPLLRFIAAFGPRLHKISPCFVADPNPVGGSLFRIYRDTRFSRDKSPYKTMAAAQFRHEEGKDVHAPGFYLHLEPGNVFAGAGLWHPDTRTQAKIREAMVEHPTRWKRAISAKSFRQNCTLAGEALKRPPRGYDAEHPLIEDLKRKDFIAVTSFNERTTCSPEFMSHFVRACRAASPLVQFLTEALGLAY
ncbi:MAG: DUF2461 domain-containing protein [Vicinamibacteria bacterium]